MTIPGTFAATPQLLLCPYARTSHAYLLKDKTPRMIASACNRWKCEVCGPRRKAHLVRRIVAAAPTKFMTLTCLHVGTPSEQLTRIKKALPRLITSLRSKHGPIEYLRMLEHCADEYPHFHLLLRSGFLPHAEIVTQWTKNTGAYIVDIRKAHGRSVNYVAKYLGKARDCQGKWGRQRISVSQRFWPKREPGEDLIGWEHETTHPQDYAAVRPQVHFQREWLGRYVPQPRMAGDVLPEELQQSTQLWRG